MLPLVTESAPSQSVTSRDMSTTLPNGKDDEAGIIGAKDPSSSVDRFFARLLRRLDLRFIPAFMLMYTLSFFAIANIGNVRILNTDTGDSLLQVLKMTDEQFSLAVVISAVSYAISNIPSNYMLKYLSPRRWLPIIMVGWGATEMIMAIIQNYSTLLGLRFLLGVFVAGLIPGIIYTFTVWYRLRERALRLSLIMAAGPLGGAFGGVITYAVGSLDRVQGLQAWRWLFIIEGAPSCLLAIFVYSFLPSYPEKAGWLSPDDRALAMSRMKQETSKSLGHATITWKGAKSTLTDWRLYLHHLFCIFVSVSMTSVMIFSPTIIDGMGYQGGNAQLFTVPPFALAFIMTVTTSWLADRYRMWSTWAMVSMAFAGTTFIVEGVLPPTAFKARYAMLCLGTTFIYASYPSFLTWFTGNLRDTNATTLAIPMNVASMTFGEMIGMFIYKSAEAPGYPTGNFTNGAVLFAGAICIGVLKVIYKKRNRGLAVGECPWIT
ncbi:MFS transporter [Armillaria luteobubalina]|uniref:MFS transporter n=1 Tax=Armillaria luteobubalina TaxID=153913 RepID=A0AA39Q7N0_9AGAR|nr:MFS transporter [Armillaria luteobubalina]